MSMFSSDGFKLVATALIVVLVLICSVVLALMFVPSTFWHKVPFRTLAIVFLLLYPVLFVARLYWRARRKRAYWAVLIGLAVGNGVFVAILVASHTNPGTIAVASVFGLEVLAVGWAFYHFFNMPPPSAGKSAHRWR